MEQGWPIPKGRAIPPEIAGLSLPGLKPAGNLRRPGAAAGTPAPAGSPDE
jgi:hypothetical protein